MTNISGICYWFDKEISWRLNFPGNSNMCSTAFPSWQHWNIENIRASHFVLFDGNPWVTGAFTSQRAHHAWGFSMSWGHRAMKIVSLYAGCRPYNRPILFMRCEYATIICGSRINVHTCMIIRWYISSKVHLVYSYKFWKLSSKQSTFR